MLLYMDINYFIDNNNQVYSVYISDNKEIISTQIDEETFYYLFNYLYEKIFINYLFILFIFTCGGTIFFCNYSKKKKHDYVMIHNQDSIPVTGQIIEKI